MTIVDRFTGRIFGALDHRRYFLAFCLVPLILGFGTVAANYVIDPWGVFGTNVLPRQNYTNVRYTHFEDYLRERERVDTLVMGSSRAGYGFLQEDIQQAMPEHAAAHLWAFGGHPIDYQVFLRGVLADKDSRGQRLRRVVILLDIDLLGTDLANAGASVRHHPDATGESWLSFYAANLLMPAWRAWLRKIRFNLASGLIIPAANASIGPAIGPDPFGGAPGPAGPERPSRRRQYEAHVTAIGDIIALTRARGIELVLMTSPIHPRAQAGVAAGEIDAALRRIAAQAPIWRFDLPEAVARDPGNWFDLTHFRPVIGRAMLARVFATPGVDPIPGLGTLIER